MAYLDQAVEADPDFADARAFRTVIFDRLGQTDLVCEEASTLLALNPPQFFIDQTADIRARNNCS
jgi:Tfp pilus assembly protein PilF